MIEWLLEFFEVTTGADLSWLLIGIGAQLLFASRMLVQWIASERQKRSIVPPVFWWISIFGALILLAYGVREREPVIILGQSFGFIVYARNLWFIHRVRKEDALKVFD